jgi:dipeptidyl-peptidase-4
MLFVPVVLAMLCACAGAQDRFATLPGYERYQEINANYAQLVRGGDAYNVEWNVEAGYVDFITNGERLRFDLATRAVAPAPEETEEQQAERASSLSSRRPQPRRGRQRDSETSPDEQWVATSQGWNVRIESADGETQINVTTRGHRKVRYGTASWVYGEELDQDDAMWWSPDSTMLAFYEFDERNVKDFYLLGSLTEVRPELLLEGYPKPGEPNPIARLMVYHLDDGATTSIDVGSDTEQYVFNVQWTKSGGELLFFRTNRLQNELELFAADPHTGSTRLILRETQETWQENRPTMQFLNDGMRFIWETEKNGVSQFELRNLDGSLVAALTPPEFDAVSIEEVNDDAGVLYYMARSDAHPLNVHLHRVNFDGTNERRLTQEPARHRVQISPDRSHFISTYQSATDPPVSAIYTIEGERLATLAEADLSRFHELGLEMPELFSFTAADGETELFGLLFKPSDFDPTKKFPLIVDVYGGPFFQTLRNTFRPAMSHCEFGCLIAILENRGTTGRGKQFESATYLKLGTVDMADQAEGVKALRDRPYVDGNRVGIHGHSYGGYMSALAVLRYPDVFHVAVAGAPVTDWRNYDTIYTERYMRTPEQNPEGYNSGSCMTYASQFRGRLLIMHGMADDNVYPTNAWQLIDAMQRAGKRIDMTFFPSRGHGLARSSGAVQWEYFYDNLINIDVAEGASAPAMPSQAGDEESEENQY